MPVSCDKTGLAFATASAGWLSGACFSLSDALLASRDTDLAHLEPTDLPSPLPGTDGTHPWREVSLSDGSSCALIEAPAVIAQCARCRGLASSALGHRGGCDHRERESRLRLDRATARGPRG